MNKTKVSDKITEIALKRLTSADNGKVLREAGGIVGRVRAGMRGVTVWFRMDFKLGGQKRDHTLGS